MRKREKNNVTLHSEWSITTIHTPLFPPAEKQVQQSKIISRAAAGILSFSLSSFIPGDHL
jgi:hypothetical protein